MSLGCPGSMKNLATKITKATKSFSTFFVFFVTFVAKVSFPAARLFSEQRL